MSLYKSKYRIESNRLKDWDYSDAGIYFLTLCSANRENIFGDIINDKMILNLKGKIVSDEINSSIKIRDNWVFHNWVIMPNHIHLLIEIKMENVDYSHVKMHVETHCSASLHGTQSESQSETSSNIQPIDQLKLYRSPKSISSFVAQFKSVITRKINTVDDSIDSVWQKNYHDSIMRNQEMFQNVYFYIQNNPKNWDSDSLK